MGKHKKKKPEIRFKGFTDDWEQRKLGDMGTTFSGLSGKTKKDFGCGDAKFITYMNVYTNAISDIDMTEKVGIDNKQHTVHYGDIMFTTSSETPEEVGMSSVWLGNEENIYLNSFCFGFRPTEILNSYYMAYMLRSDATRKNIIYLAQGISRYNISKNRVMDIEVPITTLHEQDTIGSYFDKLDHLITLHQRKLNKLKKVKKSMLEKMFPQNGEMEPQIRFCGFNSTWEQRKLGEMATFSKGIGYSKSDLQDSGKPIILYGRLYTKYETVISNVDTFAIEKPNSVISKGKEVIVPASGETAEDIAVASVVGEAGVLLGGDLNIIVALNNLNSEFLAITISNGKPHTDIAKMAQGKSVVHIHNSDLEKINILHPDYTEQCKLSMYFSNIDHLITLHQRKLEKLKKIKKAMLEKMFV